MHDLDIAVGYDSIEWVPLHPAKQLLCILQDSRKSLWLWCLGQIHIIQCLWLRETCIYTSTPLSFVPVSAG